MVEPHLGRNVPESAVAVVPEQARAGGLRGHSQRVGRDVLDPRVVGGDEQVQPPVVVVIEEPRRKAASLGSRDARLRSHVGERSVAVVAVQPVRPDVGDVDVEVAVIVEVARRDALAVPVVADAGGVGDVRERAVTVVAIQLRRVVAAGRVRHLESRLVADEQIEIAVVIKVAPRGGLGRPGGRRQARMACHVGERSVAVVAHQ